MFADVINRILDGLDFFGVFVGDFDIEFFLQSHDQLNRVQRIRTSQFNLPIGNFLSATTLRHVMGNVA
jgi:hypothetical protein